MRRNHIPPYDELEPRNGVLVVDGFGIALTVERGHLVVEDGAGRIRRCRRFSKAGHGLRRVVALGTTGYITLEALSWLDHLRIPFFHISQDGRPLLTAGRVGLHDARLLRAQAAAAGFQEGLEISQDVLERKLSGQLATAQTFSTAKDLEALVERLAAVDDMEGLLRLEAAAAAEYWSLWADLPIRFVRRDIDAVPAHWLRFGTRSSVVSGRGPRLAANPANAILNYLYALLEAETTLACRAVGLEPQLGFFHADQPSRNSLAADLMEAVRPQVDRAVLELIGSHVFSRREFIETPQGVCRLASALSHRLAATSADWFAAVGPVVEDVAASLRSDQPTLVTGRRRRSAHGGQHPESRPSLSLDQGCLDCGAQTRSRWCSDCQLARRAEWLPELSERAQKHLERARGLGRDPAHGGPAARKRGETNRRRQQEIQAWEAEHERPDPTWFTSEIQPRLPSVRTADMVRVTGLSRPYCAMIRRGAYVPHPKHWQALAALVGSG